MNPADLKVLVVDDDPAMLRLLAKWLDEAGYRVQTAGDGRRALDVIEADCPDFLVTDWEMPEVDGLELCRQVRQLPLPHYVYTVFLTAHAARDQLVSGLDAGADDFLTKPVDQRELLARMRAGTRILDLERRLSLLARTDPLTGLLTQRTFYEVLAKEWQRARRFHLPLSCVMIDLDFFKRVNDTHGHPAGDALLKAVAGLLARSCRGCDTVCRYGGEEFCALLPETNECEAAAWAERVRRRLAGLAVRCGGEEIRVTASFGTAQRHDDTQTSEELVDLADQALLCAKQSGRDRVVRYESLSDAHELTLEGGPGREHFFHGTQARHVMTPLVACLREDETLGQAAEFFLRSRINSTPVVGPAGALAGVLSEKDVLAAMVSLECWQRPVREVMKPHVICYEQDTPIRIVYEFLCRVSIRRVVITDRGAPVGTISRATLLRWFRNLLVSRGLLADQDMPRPGQPDPFRAKQRLAESARELAGQASDLERRFQECDDDLVPHVVGGATAMQELLNDLLAYSRFANPLAGLAAAEQALLLDVSHLD